MNGHDVVEREFGLWNGLGQLDSDGAGDDRILGLVIAALLALFRPRRSTRSELRGTNAQHLLDERYARGEIDDDEYRSRSEALDRSSRRHESR